MKRIIKKLKDNASIQECDLFFSIYWQNIILIAALIVFLLFVGKWILDWKHEEKDAVEAMSERTPGQMAEVKSEDVEEQNTEAASESVKRAYLTFDDGPSKQTGEILDILQEYDVKATFFVIGRDESYYDMYRRIVAEGHTLGLHSYSHDYDEIYASKDNFVKDVEKLRELLYDVTGVSCSYYRFPGGSANTVSSVPMEELISWISDEKLVYFDWNALNNDAVTEGQSPEQLVEHVLADALNYEDTIILMHDLDVRHETVESLPLLISRLREEGYSLLPIDENTPRMQQKTINKKGDTQ